MKLRKKFGESMESKKTKEVKDNKRVCEGRGDEPQWIITEVDHQQEQEGSMLEEKLVGSRVGAHSQAC